MEIIDSKCEFTLDKLPALVIENIARYLSVKDLAACCAVSRGMRVTFDDDFLWKPYYDSDRVEYLMKTPCKVHPIFESPEDTNNDLSPISQSRLAFMVENHLWNNWRQGKFTKKQPWALRTKEESEYCYRPINNIFVTDDYVATIFLNRIEISDVRNSPASCAFKPIPIKIHMNTHVRIANNKIIVLNRGSVQVFHLNVSTNQWMLKHSFLIEEAEVLPDERLLQADFDFFKGRPHCTFTILDHYIVGAEENDKMHIWNFETGVKIKTELCPVEDVEIVGMYATTSKDVILSVVQGKNNNLSLFLAYSLSQLKFLEFRQIVPGVFISIYEYQVLGNFLLVWIDNWLNIYDYQNCQQILVNYPIKRRFSPKTLGSKIMFIGKKRLKLFNPFTSKMQTLEHEDDIEDFVVFGRFIQVKRYNHESYNIIYELLDIRDNGKILVKACYSTMFDSTKLPMNKSTTRCITISTVWNFW